MRSAPLVLLLAGATLSPAPSTARVPLHAAHSVRVVTVHAKEFAFDMPASIPAGPTTFRLVNDGAEAHHLTVIKLEQGKTVADFVNALKTGAPPAWAVSVGGPNAAVHGQTTAATIDVEPGTYVVVCFIASPGDPTPHAAKGMVRPLTVTAGGVTQAGEAVAQTTPDPRPDIHLVMKEYGYQFARPITAGAHTVHVMNEGAQEHEAVALRMAPGKHVTDFLAWLTGAVKRPPPAAPIDRMSAMVPGRTGIFTADFTPGSYAIVCFVSDKGDGKAHIEHGMTVEFEVR